MSMSKQAGLVSSSILLHGTVDVLTPTLKRASGSLSQVMGTGGGEGAFVGDFVGALVGALVGLLVGSIVGVLVGVFVGAGEGGSSG